MAGKQFVSLCPGLGGRQPRLSPEEVWSVVGTAKGVWAQVDEAVVDCGHKPLSPYLAQPQAQPPEGIHAELLRFAIAVALHEVLLERGASPYALLGHSLGHQAALACAGAFDVADSIRLLVARSEVILRDAPPGGMTSLEVGADRARSLVAMIADPLLAVACHNTPTRTVVSGPGPALTALESLADGLGVSALRLSVPFAYHGPMMRGLVEPLREATAGVRQRPLRVPVISTVTGRWCADDDDLLNELAVSVAKPVRFVECVRQAQALGIREFVEYGTKPLLANLVRHTVPHARTFHCLDAYTPGPTALRRVLDGLSPGAA